MRFGGIVLAAALLLGACSSDPAPKEPTPSTSEGTPTPARAAPTMPPQAAEDSPEGAAAFVKHYIDVFNYAAATGDVTELTRLSSPDCEGCQSYAHRFQEIYDEGKRVSVQLWTLTSEDLSISAGTRVSAAIDVNEGGLKRYRFNFTLPPDAPFVVEDIKFEAPS